VANAALCPEHGLAGRRVGGVTSGGPNTSEACQQGRGTAKVNHAKPPGGQDRAA